MNETDFEALCTTLQEMAIAFCVSFNEAADALAEAIARAMAVPFEPVRSRRSVSRPRVQEYKRQGPLVKTRYRRPWQTWDTFELAAFLERARGPPLKTK